MTTPCVGARFRGRNHHAAMGEWETTSFVNRYEPLRAFGWAVTDPDDPSSSWWFELEQEPAGVRLRQGTRMGPAPSGLTIAITAMPDKEERIVARRLDGVRDQHAAPRSKASSALAEAQRVTLRVGVGAMPFTAGGVEFVREAERLGVDSVWVPEFWAGDALTPLAYLAAQTSRRSGSPPASCSSAPARRRCSRCRRFRCRRCRAAGSCSASAPAARR